MATLIGVRFPWGRYHATPWGRSVNEAAIEWPPSPWRILRALYCTWKCRAPDLSEGEVLQLLGRLAEPPSYALPRHLEAHTRHYMPNIAHGTDKVFDPFAVTARNDQVLVRWQIDLDNQSRSVLAKLLDLLPYLGRAESVCEARLLPAEPPDIAWVTPHGGSQGATTPPVRLLTATAPLDTAALVLRTTDVRRRGRILPPGTRWVSYYAPPATIEHLSPAGPRRRPPQVVRLVIDGPVTPSLYSATAACDLLRRAAMRAFGTPPSPILAGKDAEGTPLRGHTHAHYLALDSDGDRLLDRLVVWAPAGLDDAEVRAIAGLRRLSTGQPVEGLHPVRIALEAAGEASSAAPELAGPARTWMSHTPFAPPRHQPRKVGYEDFIKSEVCRELASRRLPAADVEPLSADWLRFRRRRLSEHLGCDRRAIGLSLRFTEPVAGPLCLGALSHFGLGVFVPDSD